jgi:hypothetical protein
MESNSKEVAGILSQAKDAILQRIDSTIVGSFVVIWCIDNWQVPVFLLFSNGASSRISDIGTYLEQTSMCQLLWIPLALTVAYVFLMPLMQWGYGLYVLKIRKRQISTEIAVEHSLNVYRQYGKTLPQMFEINRGGMQYALSKFDQLANMLKGLGQFKDAQPTAEEALRCVVEVGEKLKEIESRLQRFETASLETLNQLIELKLH